MSHISKALLWFVWSAFPLSLILFSLGDKAIQANTVIVSSPLEISLTASATPTLIPLPTITIAYPSPSATPFPVYTFTLRIKEKTPNVLPQRNGVNPGSLGLALLVILIWILLAGWLYILVSSATKNHLP